MNRYANEPANDPRDVAAATGLTPLAAASSGSGVTWSAVFAGAAAAAALSLMLLLLGTGLGLSAISPWSTVGEATAVGAAAIAWLTFTQLAASGAGGYLAGRLRTKWSGVHTEEVFFRDTAHGFLAWCVATLLMASVLTSAVGSVLGAGVQLGGTAAGAATGAAASAAAGNATSTSSDTDADQPLSYFVDSLFRRDAGMTSGATTNSPSAASAAPAEPLPAATAGEVTRILAKALSSGSLPAEDAKHVASLVAQRTGMSQQDAEKRVNDTFAKTQATLNEAKAKAAQAADAARRASAYTALWLVASMFFGAFVASFAATYGGRRRDL